MNITRLNFKQTLPFISNTLKKCHFYAFDLEMTGIKYSQKFNNSILDSHEMRYWKIKNGVQRFLPVQLGVCGLQICSEKKIVAHPFNFYIYPLILNDSDSRSFAFSSGSMKFLSENNFDFNKLFYQGIYFVSKEDQLIYEGQYKAQQLKRSLKKMDKIITPDMNAFLNLHKQRIIHWLKNQQGDHKINIKFIRYRAYKHLLNVIRDLLPNISFYQIYDKEQLYRRQVLTLTKIKPENSEKKQNTNEKQQVKIEDHIKLSTLMQEISESKKPIIVHNGFLDLMHIYHKFFGELPDKLTTFKQKINKTFPLVYDTKFIASNSIIIFNKVNRQTHLESTYKNLSKEQYPQVVLSQDFQEYNLDQSEKNSHQAGYDALMTGIVYFKQMGLLKLISEIQNFDFNDKMVYFRNRIPLGNIPVPLNLQQKEEIYKKQGDKIFFLMPVIYSPLTQTKIKDYFDEKFGKVKIFWTSRFLFNFTIIFQEQNAKNSFENFLNETNGLALINIENVNLIVYNEQRYDQYLKGIRRIEEFDENRRSKDE